MGKSDLKSFLEAAGSDRVALTFRQVEILLGERLPASAWARADRQGDTGENDIRDVGREAGFAEVEVHPLVEQVVFLRTTAGEQLESADAEPKLDASGRKRRRHPAFGAFKGMITVEPGYDLTQPTIDPEWLKEKYGE